MPDGASQRHQLALKLAVLVLTVAAIGLPVNNLEAYGLLVIACVVVFSGAVRVNLRAWMGAGAIVVIAVGGQILLAPPRIDEGHNVFLPSPALKQGLPGDVYRHLKDEFDKEYPPGVRCAPGSTGCWQNGGKNQGLPDRPFAFSPDGIFQKSKMSRSVTEIDFSDPVWLRLGFINEIKYNWYTAAPDVHRADRDRRIWMGLNRWHLTMPWFEMIRLPAAMVGGKLCWRGDVLWESAAEHFALWRGDGCRDIEPADAGVAATRQPGADDCRGGRPGADAGAVRTAASGRAMRTDRPGDDRDCGRRCQLPRWCTALRRRRRWALLRGLRTRHS
jgi:hypothetical protein